ncbi:unnamed protein product [Medioppia subpectinata]|uniref:Uncharacterized protein n=1 Tax=Medioppia subpectinata TaxID=1979941 RepID=A0A7R9Q1N8_9ACAR|nr:unnamed protein product [Medioppia subpectinata]CAG2109427.1 unnamed protein product [Medioppia subpectinata]
MFFRHMFSIIIVLILLGLWSERVKTRADASGELARIQNINISDLLDHILHGYDNHIRPDFGGPPTEVFIDFHVRSMGPISEIDMTYVMDCYFRQTWTDRRLSYKTKSLMEMNANQTLSPPALALSIYMLDRIWKPPTYFLNSRQSHLHVITLPNKFVRIYSDGKVLYSSRMTITANCPMNLANFPMDTQRCPLALGSFGYSMQEVVYSWNPARKVVINPDMKMSQFDLIAVPVGNKTNDERKDGPYSILLASFHFQRHMGSFVIEVYAPCIMLVVLSWLLDQQRSNGMTITANCPMNLANFPMDTQRCPLALGSFGYSMQEVVYSWNPARKVVINPDMKMSQFDLIAVPVGNKTNDERKDGPYSILLASFHFQRHMGSFVIEVYAPCIMLVVLSWVSFWINREATGLTTVLTMTFLGLELRNDLPKVPYLTALDYFVYISFAFISATILEFGFVHFFTKIGSGEYYFSPTSFMQLENSSEMDDNYSSGDEYEDYDDYTDGAHTVRTVMTAGLRPESNKSRHDVREETADNDYIRRVRDTSKESPIIFDRQQSEIYSTERDRAVIVLKKDDNMDAVSSGSSSQASQPIQHYDYDYDIQQPTTSTFGCSHQQMDRHSSAATMKRENERQMSRLSSIRASIRNTFSRKKSRRRPAITLQLNSVSKIDRISRVIFPLLFVIMNLVYWYTFLRAEMKFDPNNQYI